MDCACMVRWDLVCSLFLCHDGVQKAVLNEEARPSTVPVLGLFYSMIMFLQLHADLEPGETLIKAVKREAEYLINLKVN